MFNLKYILTSLSFVALLTNLSINTYAYTPEYCLTPVNAYLTNNTLLSGQKILKQSNTLLEFGFSTNESTPIFGTSNFALDGVNTLNIPIGNSYSANPNLNPKFAINSNQLSLGNHTTSLSLSYKCRSLFVQSISFEIVDKLDINQIEIDRVVNCKANPGKMIKSFNCSGRINTKNYTLPKQPISFKYGINGNSVKCKFIGTGGNFGCDNIKVKNTDNQTGDYLYVSFDGINYTKSTKFIQLK